MPKSFLEPPEPTEVEISIFGPGKGESILVHLGGGQWIIVDSCVDQPTKQVPVLTYLKQMGVDVAKNVIAVVGTHAHDDHIAGLSRVLQECEAAKFVCSSALTSEEFMCSIEADADIELLFRASIRSEYRRIFEILDGRGNGPGDEPPLLRAVELRRIWSRPESTTVPAAQVIALSPSDHAVTRSLNALATGLAIAGNRRRLQQVDPNEFAVALSVTVGDVSLLLGADLTAGPQGCGWGAVVATFTPDVRASVFKIPHHGSPNAHHDDVWTQLVTPDVIALVAPFRMGRRPLPAPDDVARVKTTSRAVYCSANPRPPAPGKAVKETRAALSSLGAINVRFEGRAGQVRARWLPGANGWEVDCIAPAMQL